MPELVIFGTGSLARLARRYFDSDSDYDVVAFTVDAPVAGDADEFEGLPLVPFEELPEWLPPPSVDLFVAIGYRGVNRGRAGVFERVAAAGYPFATYVSSAAVVAPGVDIGRNCFLFEGVIVQPFCTIGDDTVIWSGAVVAHDTKIGRHCFLAPRASVSGEATIEDYCFIGNNATVRDGITLGEGTVVGAGGLAKWDTEPGAILRPSGTMPLEGRSSSELDDL